MEKSLSDAYKKQEISKSYRKASVNLTLESLVWSCTKGNVLKAVHLKGISSIIVISFSSSVSVFEEVLEIMS